ncbi:hypothetical protein [Streptomyces sp. NPDC056632]|uniref:hypothetical protein n=1 Tax=Streptomyces sp. NPDC056632 TaxID=3345884 RepID=UPI0036964F55
MTGCAVPPEGDRRSGTACAGESRVSGVAIATAILELVVCLHQAVLGDDQGITGTIARLRDLTEGGDYAYYTDIAAFMADWAVPPSSARWIDGEAAVRKRWRQLVTACRALLDC